MDPKHILQALGARYIEEHGGHVLMTPASVLDAIREMRELDTQIIFTVGGNLMVANKAKTS